MTATAPVNLGAPPRQPICRSAEDLAQPCQFSDRCVESRQRIAHYANPPLRGGMCWKFQQLSATLGSDAQRERAAIQAEEKA